MASGQRSHVILGFLKIDRGGLRAKIVVMYIEGVPNRNSPAAVLLRESYREGGKVRKRTLANLSKLPDDIVDNMRLALKGAKVGCLLCQK